MRLARLARGARDGAESVDTTAAKLRDLPAVGGHLRRNCGTCRPFAWTPPPAHRQPRRPQVARHGGPIDVHRRGNAARRPSEPPEREDLLLFGLLQDVTHPGEGHQVRRPRQRLGRRQLIAGFEVSIKCGI